MLKAIINANVILFDKILNDAVIVIKDGRICDVGKGALVPEGAEVIDAKGMLVGPGFVDNHVHGDGGANRWEIDPQKTAHHHLLHGTTTMTATMSYSQTPESLLKNTKIVQGMIDDGLLPNVYAVSFEGPFVNPERGAKSRQFARIGPDPLEYMPLFEATGGKVAWWMYAPEMDTDGSFGDFLQKNNFTAAVGHTNASPKQIRAAVDKGARIATHLFDAMGCYLGNDSWNITGTIQETAAVGCLICPELTYELIPDSLGIHVKPANLTLVYQMAGPDRIAIVTDCTICGYDPADYPKDHFRSTVDLNYNELGQLSGSRLTMDRAVKNFKAHTGATIPELFRMASLTPARVLGIDNEVGSVQVGKLANLVFLDDELNLKQVIFMGEKI